MQVPLIAALLVFWSLGQASPTDSSRSIAHHHRYYEHRSTKSNKTYGLSKLIHMRAPVKKREKRGFIPWIGEMMANAGMGKKLMEDNKITSAQNAILKEREFQLKEKKLQTCCYIAIFAIVAVVGVIALGAGFYFLTKNNDPNPIFGSNRSGIVSSSSSPPPPPPVKLNFQQTLFQMISDKFALLFVLFILITSAVLCVVRLRTLVAKRILVNGSRRVGGGGGGAGISSIYSQSSPSTAKSYYSNQTKNSKFNRVPTSVNSPPSNFNRVPTSVNCPPSNFNRLK